VARLSQARQAAGEDAGATTRCVTPEGYKDFVTLCRADPRVGPGRGEPRPYRSRLLRG